MVIALSTGLIFAQSGVLQPPAEPFNLQKGSSFSASVPNSSPYGSTRLAAALSDLAEAESIITSNHFSGRTIKNADLTSSAVDGMLRSLDPHSSFFDRRQWSDLLDEQRAGYTGIGITISDFERSGSRDTYVLGTFFASPAARVKLNFGDKITAVDGRSVRGMSSGAVRDKIRGEPGTVVKLTVERFGSGKLETLEIRRGKVSQPSIPDSYLVRPGIGYIALSDGFNFTTSEELDASLTRLKQLGMRSLILDLRGNGGGIVDQAVKVAERFLPTGTLILTQRGRARADNREWFSSNPRPETLPLVVLVDRETASASEIVAGAFQDDDRAWVIGEKTFGKGLVQSVISLPGGTGMTLTAARYLTPSGRSIQRYYSQGGNYDYFNHSGTTSAVGNAFFEARTLTNRRVFGGDGIHPDEQVIPQKITRSQADLIDPIFAFCSDLIAGRIAGVEPPNTGDRPSQVMISDHLIEAFISRTGGERFSRESLSAQTEFIRRRIRYYLAMAAFGTVTAERVLLEDDPYIVKAIDALPRARQLKMTAERARTK